MVDNVIRIVVLRFAAVSTAIICMALALVGVWGMGRVRYFV